MKPMRKLLWVGDAACDSGFARCTHYILDVLRETWDVVVLGLNYRGDPHPYPYPIYPCWPGGDPFGVGRIGELIRSQHPDLIVLQNDPWNIPDYVSEIRKHTATTPIMAGLAVDGKNCALAERLNGLALAVFWTRFGAREARAGGYRNPLAVIPLGVDTSIYHPRDRGVAREAMQFGRGDGSGIDLANAFIVGNVNRNQPRKRLDLTIAYFAEWVRDHRVEDAFLFLHVAPTGDLGYDCEQLARYCGVGDRIILAQPGVWHGISEEQLATVYSTFDVMLTTTQGEGWGLTTLEGMACGVPQIVPDWAALGEWAAPAAAMVPCTEIAVTPNKINVIGGVPDRVGTIDALQRVYEDEAVRRDMSAASLALARRDDFQWRKIGEGWRVAIDHALTMQDWT